MNLALFPFALAAPPAADATFDEPDLEDTAIRAHTEVPSRTSPQTSQKNRMSLGLHARYVSVPAGILNTWFDNAHDAVWPLPGQSRPKLKGYTIGLTFSVLDKKHLLLDAYVEYAGVPMKEGYWDDRDDPPNGLDGDWLRPTRGFGAVVLGFNLSRDIPILHPGRTHGVLGMSFLVGGGVGIAILTGSIDQWKPRLGGLPTFVRAQNGEDPDQKVNFLSPVWPSPALELGFRMVFVQRLELRVLGGLHGGLSLGGNLAALF